jgi:AcrR family transcriptional regulator
VPGQWRPASPEPSINHGARRVAEVEHPEDENAAAPPWRRYVSPTRREQAERTRERIIAAGSELVHRFATWDWSDLTVRAVARQAAVSESTVYRHFSSERLLRDAVMRRLQEEAGVELESLQLDNFGAVVGRLFAYLSSFPMTPPPIDDPTFAAIDQRRREALVTAVARSAAGWSQHERKIAAAALDMFWDVPAFERLTTVWGLDAQQATRTANWVVRLIETAIRDGQRP